MTTSAPHNISNRIVGYICLTMVVSLIAASLAACGNSPKVIFSDFVDIPESGWNCREYCRFSTERLDSNMLDEPSARYNVILSLRHTDQYPYASLIMPLTQSLDSCTALPDTLRIPMIDTDGNWLASQSKGIYTLTDTLLKNSSLPPRYSLCLYHAMPCENLQGLISVGIIIQKL
ncbi:MAG: gliding motility lipoprotein GldH [Prevotella sp.]|nr:gliding motility lipoprotein GldH [Prevotella sp.]MCM1075349.1 gliding motility lipoprotein GldH [Ruminococcus sp.]